MMNKEGQRLIDYIEDVLQGSDHAELDLDKLKEEYRPLGEAVKKLGEHKIKIDGTFQRMTQQIEELVQNPADLEKNRALSSEQNTEQNFDTMVQELRKRTLALENERNLFIQFTESASERIIVLDEETGELVFANKIAREFYEQTNDYIDQADILNEKSGCSLQNSYSQWMHTVTHPRQDGSTVSEYYQVHSLYILWENRSAIAHMFSNVTEMQEIQTRAKTDVVTGVFNRAYAMEYLETIYHGGACFAIAFVDVDYLKYCNDTWGHSAGDDYLRQVADLLRQTDVSSVVCRTGGDEFLVISQSLDETRLMQAVEKRRQILCKEYFPDGQIHKSFSYGIAAYKTGSSDTVQQLLADADERMYQNKLENKKKNHLALRDERMI